MADRYVIGKDVPTAWLQAVRTVEAMPRRQATHLVVRIESPSEGDLITRGLLNALLLELGLDSVETVRNTLFPTEWAAKFPEPTELAEYYRGQLATIARFQDRGQFRGTYFGRLVDFPRGNEGVDQLSDVVEKLRHAHGQKRRVTSRYEMNIYSEERDHRKLMGFPCLSFCSFHLGDGVLHMSAHYRSHFMIQRAYGNYLGLAELLNYVAAASGFPAGELLVISGHATIDKVGVRRLEQFLERVEDASGSGD